MSTQTINSPESAGTFSAGTKNSIFTGIMEAYYGLFNRTRTNMLGFLEAIDIENHRALVAIPSTPRTLWFKFPPYLTSAVSNCVQSSVEITGKISVDKSDYPQGIKCVRHIAVVNTSDIMLSDVLPGKLKLRISKDVPIRVVVDDSKQFYWATHEGLELYTTGFTRMKLVTNLTAILLNQWENLVKDDISTLSASAQRYKKILLSTIEERS